MKSSSLSYCPLLTLAFCGLASAAMFAQDITPPVVANPIADLTVSANASPTVIKLKKTFALQGVTGTVVRFTTTLGNMDVELDAADYPLNVANFLGYVNSGSYNGTFIHRSIGNFIFQGGGYNVAGDKNYPHIAVNAAVAGEHKQANTTGTIAMALTSGANSANSGTSEWFFNLANNTTLDDGSNNQGPFTAFGRVIEGDLSTMTAIGAVETYDASSVVVSSDQGVFTDLPLINYTSAQGTEINPDLVYISNIAVIPLTPKASGDPALLDLTANSSNPGLVTATISGQKLTLTYAQGQTGTATIKVKAKDSAKSKTKATFTVSVQ